MNQSRVNRPLAGKLVGNIAQVQVPIMLVNHLNAGSHVLSQLIGRDIGSGQCASREIMAYAVKRSGAVGSRV